jgi:hypothetical protein
MRREGAIVAFVVCRKDGCFRLSLNKATKLADDFEKAADDARDHLEKVTKLPRRMALLKMVRGEHVQAE